MSDCVEIQEVAVINPRSVIPSICDDTLVTFLPMASVSENGCISYQEERAFGDVCKGYTCFKEGDILLAKITPCMENGKAALVSNLTNRIGFGSTEFHVLRPGDKIDGRYLFYMIWNPFFRQFARENMTGSAGQKRVPAESVKRYKIPLPPLRTQKRIADVLDKAQELVEKRKQQIEMLDEFLRSVFLDMFGDPVTNSKGWTEVKLSLLGTLQRGKSRHRPRDDPRLLGGPFPLVQTGDIANSGIMIRDYSQTYSEFGLAQSRLWKAGTLCITIAANIAKTAILSFDACFPDSVVGFMPNQKTNVFFMRFWFSFLQAIIEAAAPMSAQRNINLRILEGLDVINPPIELQNQFAEVVETGERQKQLMEQGLEEMENAFNSIMQRAFKGELFN